VTAVAHHQSPAFLVTLVGKSGDLVIDLGLERLGQHPPNTLTNELVDQRNITRIIALASSGNYGEHGSYPSNRRWRADPA
jgi:hypothetical protein